MKELLLQYAGYNVWANKLVADAMLKMEGSTADDEIVSSYSSYHKTVRHLLAAEYIWLQRLQLAERPLWIQDTYEGSFADTCKEWQRVSAELVAFVAKQMDDRAFEHVCLYHDNAGAVHKMPVFQILQHVFNHSTYHRGQLVTMLRQLGITNIPRTDFILFAKKKS